jgi:PAS domain S-box-containing protein/putative nucleotidyltransferase with HDIG domain
MTITNTDQPISILESPTVYERLIQLETENAKLRQERVEQKRGEEQLRNLLNNSSDIVFQLSPKGEIEYVSPKVRDIYGYNPDELIGQLFEKTTPLSELPKVIKAISKALCGETIRNLEIGQIDAQGNIVVVEINSSPVMKDGKVVALQGVLRDITFRKKAEEAARVSSQKLFNAMEDTLQAMAMIVEMRDPYTAGHQRRVSQLACAIAEEIGMLPDHVTGLRLAGLIHDIGKVRVPAEILSNPNTLSAAEMAILKMHPTLGYEVLKMLDMPWPVAQIIYQHHERINGSGYPAGLTGANILLEARILAVADVVEAISTHRPYRPAHSLSEAMDEIFKEKNNLYDNEVVDSCIKVLKQKDFKFQ